MHAFADVTLYSDGEMAAIAPEDARLPHRLHHTRDGVDALAFLRRDGPYAAAARPDVILLDLNMPRMTGLELLDILKLDAELRSIPVIVLTTSRAESDIWRSYNLHANAYIPKPVSIAEFEDVIQTLGNFWFRKVALPHRPD